MITSLLLAGVAFASFGITLGASSGARGNTVTVTDANTGGSHWHNGDTISVTITGHAGNIGNSVVAASNTFTGLNFTVPSDTTIGVDTVNVSDSRGNSAIASFTVNTPSITLGASIGKTGDVISITGSNYHSGDTITVTITGHTGNIVTSTITVSSGSFSGTIAIPSDATEGSDTVTASDTHSNSATKTFTFDKTAQQQPIRLADTSMER